MAEFGGALPREGIGEKVRRDVKHAAADAEWIKMIIDDDSQPGAVAGTVALWRSDHDGGPIAEIGWMVLPEFQGRGVAKWAVRTVLSMARDDGRWGLVSAFPAVTNGPSNGICRSLGFRLAGQQDVMFAGHVLRTNHWVVNPQTGPAEAGDRRA